MSEDSIFREVDEELRSERMQALWRRFAPYVIGAAVAVVALVGANEGWSWWQSSNAARSSDLLYQAFASEDAGDVAAAQEELNRTIAEGSGGYPVLARFNQAAILQSEGKSAEAAAAYDALATSASEQRLRELALVLAAYALVDDGDVAAVTNRVSGILSTEGPLRATAREAVALTQYAAGELDAALVSFEEIAADPTAAANQVGRMRIYIAQLNAEGISSAAEAGDGDKPVAE